MNTKTRSGNYFEDFRLGQEIVHATPRTVTDGDIALYTALFGSRFVVTSSAQFAAGLGLERAPIESLLAFHIVFGKKCPTFPSTPWPTSAMRMGVLVSLSIRVTRFQQNRP